MTGYFVIVGRRDNPIYELDLQAASALPLAPTSANKQPSSGPLASSSNAQLQGGQESKKDDTKPLNQFIIHSALDAVEEAAWTTTSMYLKVVDKYNESFISAFVSAGNIAHVKLLLLHDSKNEDGIKNFFQDVYESYIKILMNPFYEPHTKISSPVFDAKVKGFVKKYL